MGSYPGIASVAPNLVGTLDEVTPNDSGYASQYAPQRIRADEAWVIARGGPIIAVVDSGVDYNHPDLASKVIKGPDLVNGDADPMDDQGHGTHVAGIAAALGNNGTGIAGIAWNSPVLAIKVADDVGDVTFANGVAGIKKAADLGAKVINCSWGFKPTLLNQLLLWFNGLEAAVTYATSKGAVVVCSAGNDGTTGGAVGFPGRYASAFCVGSTTPTDGRSPFSSYGPEVSIAAPGSSILSTLMGGGTGLKSGTSMAAPCVSGAVAVLWSRFPDYTSGQIRTRLQRTAVELPGLQLGAGRIDLFEAVFNGSFEDDVTGWNVSGTAGAVPSLGPLTPTDRKKFGFASSGPDNAVVQTTMAQDFTIQPGVTAFKVTFDYNFVTEEYPEWVGRGFNDNMRITLMKPDGTSAQLAYEDVDHSSFSLVSGIDFPGGDHTTGQTGWKTVSINIPVTSGPGSYRIVVRDEGDGIYDSDVLIDRIQFK
jgi:subtilisin family serine protease